MATDAIKAKGPADSPSALERRDCQDHAKIAEEVVKLLPSSKNELIKWAVQQGMSHLHQEPPKQVQCVTEVESRTSALEDEQAYILANTDKMGKHIHALMNKVEDLESDKISITFPVSLTESKGANASQSPVIGNGCCFGTDHQNHGRKSQKAPKGEGRDLLWATDTNDHRFLAPCSSLAAGKNDARITSVSAVQL